MSLPSYVYSPGKVFLGATLLAVADTVLRSRHTVLPPRDIWFSHASFSVKMKEKSLVNEII